MKPETRKISLLLSIICALWAGLVWMLYPDFTGDDTYIHLGYVNSLLDGKGFSFGENVTNGATAPLWVLISATLASAGIEPLPLMRGMSLFFGMGVLIMVFITGRRVGFEGWFLWGAVCITAANAYFMRWAFTGMETTAAMFALLLALYIYKLPSGNKLWLSGLIFGAGTLLRPEIFLFFVLTALHHLLFQKQEQFKYRFRNSVIFLIAGLAPIAIWGAYAAATFGSILPNTFLAKAGSGLLEPTFYHLQRNILLAVSSNAAELFASVVIIAGLLISRLYAGALQFRNFAPEKILTYLSTGKGLVLLWVTGFYGYYIGKDVIILSRYALMFSPLIILGTAWLIKHYAPMLRREVYVGTATGWIITAFIFHSFFTHNVVKPASDAFVSGFQETYTEIAYLLSNHHDPAQNSIALTDVGIIGAGSGMQIYDLAGLVDHRRFEYESSAEYIQAMQPAFLLLREEREVENLLNNKAEYEVVYRNFIQGLGINEPGYRNVTLYKLNWSNSYSSN